MKYIKLIFILFLLAACARADATPTPAPQPEPESTPQPYAPTIFETALPIVELEGLVQNVVVLNPAGDSRFVIADRSVVARPGVTAIREGTTRKTVEDVTVGKQVHVKGTTVADSTDVLAYEIKLQNPTTNPPGTTGTGGRQITICHVPGGNPARARAITIDESAWPAHQAHGDTEGACPS